MFDKEKILEALAQLDPLDDDHWTGDGAPRMDAVEKILGDKTVTRKDVFEAAPEFSRDNAGKEEEQEGRKEEVSPSALTLAEIDRPLTEPEFASFLGSVPKEDLEDVVAMLKTQLGEASKSAELAKDLENRVRRAVRMAEARLRSEFPNSTDRDATRQFIETQTRQRVERVAKRQEIFGKIDPSEFDPRAPIDRAMARKTKRGGQRPNRPLLK